MDIPNISFESVAEIRSEIDPQQEYVITENEIGSSSRASLRRMKAELTPPMKLDFFDQLPDVDPLLYAAMDLEMRGFTDEAAEIYEKAGLVCLMYAEEETAVGHLNPELVAGLCFEKSPRTQEEARKAFEKARSYWSSEWMETLVSLDEDDVRREGEGLAKIQRSLFNLVFALPLELEFSLASIKLQDADGFAEIICHQLKMFSELFKGIQDYSHSDLVPYIVEDPDLDNSSYFLFFYPRAWVNVSEILLGADSPSFLQIKEAASFLSFVKNWEKFEPVLKNIEAGLLSVYAAPKNFPVTKLISMIETDPRLIRP